ncbi:unnamed protein product, partial [Ectocarpus sp. 4 AP-2014]
PYNIYLHVLSSPGRTGRHVEAAISREKSTASSPHTCNGGRAPREKPMQPANASRDKTRPAWVHWLPTVLLGRLWVLAGRDPPQLARLSVCSTHDNSSLTFFC